MPAPFPPQFPIYLPGGDTLAVDPIDAQDHAASALARLAEQFKNKPNLAALLNNLNAQTQELENAFQDLFTQRAIDTAFGEQLDVLGIILGQERGGFDDDTYRLYLNARMLLNISSATKEDLYGIFEALLDAPSTLEIKEWFPAGFVLRLSGRPFTADEIYRLIVFLRLGRGAGIRGILEWIQSDLEDMFQFDSGPGFDEGHLAGALI